MGLVVGSGRAAYSTSAPLLQRRRDGGGGGGGSGGRRRGSVKAASDADAGEGEGAGDSQSRGSSRISRAVKGGEVAVLPGQAHAVVFVRHGQSDFNRFELFTGWCDVDINDVVRPVLCICVCLLAFVFILA